MANKYWFVRKKYGWGWVPATWQGWAVLGVFSGGIISIGLRINEDMTGSELWREFYLPLIILALALVAISIIKGEKPRWQWGSDKDSKQ